MEWLGWLVAVLAAGVAAWLMRALRAERGRSHELLYEKIDLENELDAARTLNERMQAIESEADRLILGLYEDLFKNTSDLSRLLLRKDLFELLEKAIDRCRDAGNVVFQIVLKNS